MAVRSEKVEFAGLPLTIEYRKGDVRTGTDPSGKRWERKMHADYGSIERTRGLDREELDVYVGPNESSKHVFVVNQMKAPEFKTLDEQKFMIGFDTIDEARDAYLQHYPDPRILGDIKRRPIEYLGAAVGNAKEKTREMFKMSKREDDQLLLELFADQVGPTKVAKSLIGLKGMAKATALSGLGVGTYGAYKGINAASDLAGGYANRPGVALPKHPSMNPDAYYRGGSGYA